MYLSIKIARSPFKSIAPINVRGKNSQTGRVLLAEKQSAKMKIHYAEWPLKTILSGIGGFGSRNYHFKCSPLPTRGPLALDERLFVPLHRVVRLGSREEWAKCGLYYLVCLFRSLISSRPTGDTSPSNPGRSVCAFTSASILILISSAAFSSSLSPRSFAPLPVRTPDGPSFFPYYFSAFFSRRIERLLRRVARYAGYVSSLSFWPSVSGRHRQRVTFASGAHHFLPFCNEMSHVISSVHCFAGYSSAASSTLRF